MQIKIKGEMTIAELCQVVIEKIREAEDNYGVRYTRGATVFINPTNGFGDDVVPRNSVGHRMTNSIAMGHTKAQQIITSCKPLKWMGIYGRLRMAHK